SWRYATSEKWRQESFLWRRARAAILHLIIPATVFLFPGAIQGGRFALFLFLLFLGGLFVHRVLALFFDRRHVGPDFRLFARLFFFHGLRAFGQIAGRALHGILSSLERRAEGEFIVVHVFRRIVADLLQQRQHGLFRLGNLLHAGADIDLALNGVVGHIVDRIDDVGVIVQRIVDHDRAAGLVLAQEILHQVDAFAREFGVQRKTLVGVLRFFDLVHLVGGEKVAVLRHERRGQKCDCAEERLHFRFPSMRPISRSSCTCRTLSFTLSRSGRSAK